MKTKQWLFSLFTLSFLCAFAIGEAYSTAREELQAKYEQACFEPSDIYQHVPLLRQLAKNCSSVVEIGLRGMVSSWGILQGLSESSSHTRFYLGIDIQQPGGLDLPKRLAEENGIPFYFWHENDMDVNIPSTDMLFIDSLHTYCHLTYELENFAPKVSKYIAMHDTSEPWGLVDDTEYKGDYAEYPSHFDRTKRGLWPAVEDFLARHPEWMLLERHFNNCGFTVIQRLSLNSESVSKRRST